MTAQRAVIAEALAAAAVETLPRRPNGQAYRRRSDEPLLFHQRRGSGFRLQCVDSARDLPRVVELAPARRRSGEDARGDLRSDVCIIGERHLRDALGAEAVRAARPASRSSWLKPADDLRVRTRAGLARSGRSIRREPVARRLRRRSAGAGIISRTRRSADRAFTSAASCSGSRRRTWRLKSPYGLGSDWPIEWDDLERYYCEAEKRIGVAGEPGPIPRDRRSEPYPMPAMARHVEPAAGKRGRRRAGPFLEHAAGKNTLPYDGRNVCARCDTCNMCPTGARYSPDFS